MEKSLSTRFGLKSPKQTAPRRQLALGQNSCLNKGNYTSNSSYAFNLNSSFQELGSNLDNNGFYNASVGQRTDRANSMVLCRGDVQLDECQDCILEAADELLRSCPFQKQAIRWDERCMLRFSNATIFGSLETSPMWYLWNPNNATSPDQFKENLRGLLDQLCNQAASGGSLRKVAAGNATGPDFQTIFALLQCTPDLSQEECTTCLINAIANIPASCDGKRGCRVLSPSCNLRFEIYPFYNETRLRELEPAAVSPSPPPVPVLDPPSSSSGKGDGNAIRTVIIIVVPIVLSLILAVSAIIWLRKRRAQKPIENHHERVEISTAESLQYAFSTIKTATNDFSDDNKLGEGGFGSVYKGKLSNGQEIAVKRLSMHSGQGDLEFKNEVLLLAKLQHRNLVRLLGFSIQGTEKLLIYELVQNASLDQFIFDQRNQSYLDWDRRYKIIGGVARGILYLHEDSRLRIIHRDLKASNILLDRDMNPKIADFGMARLFGQDETQGNTSRVVGTYGYMPPEYIIHGQFSIKSDVFSFGVLVLEIISGRKNSNFRSGENAEDLLTFAWKNWREGTAANVMDPLLRSGSGSMSEMVRCIHIGLLCVQENATERPTMASVVIMLSSSSISLAVPSEPAFYLQSGYTSQTSRLQFQRS
ncbi:cysteine-rich RLK protein 29 [Perilla frutescens var. hirtella]|uniref:Cysteine-rich RLK protein 29 n=1 Tax=Perilla frutescens var. hirtella TaxID=608512 RepID=A0AAD4P9X2_PERFH|nr:cysteine-rich RLK protein 29 [Perilla frutescens var. hirtella]